MDLTNLILGLKILMGDFEQITFHPGNDVGGDDQIPLEEVLYNLQELGASE